MYSFRRVSYILSFQKNTGMSVSFSAGELGMNLLGLERDWQLRGFAALADDMSSVSRNCL